MCALWSAREGRRPAPGAYLLMKCGRKGFLICQLPVYGRARVLRSSGAPFALDSCFQWVPPSTESRPPSSRRWLRALLGLLSCRHLLNWALSFAARKKRAIRKGNTLRRHPFAGLPGEAGHLAAHGKCGFGAGFGSADSIELRFLFSFGRWLMGVASCYKVYEKFFAAMGYKAPC